MIEKMWRRAIQANTLARTQSTALLDSILSVVHFSFCFSLINAAMVNYDNYLYG